MVAPEPTVAPKGSTSPRVKLTHHRHGRGTGAATTSSLLARSLNDLRGARAYGGWLSVRPAPPPRLCCKLRGFWAGQAHADQPAVVIDALDRVSMQLELGHDRGRAVNPASVQLGKSDRLLAGLAQPLGQPLQLSVSEHHRRDYPPAGSGVHSGPRRFSHPPQPPIASVTFRPTLGLQALCYEPTERASSDQTAEFHSDSSPRLRRTPCRYGLRWV